MTAIVAVCICKVKAKELNESTFEHIIVCSD